MFVFVRSQTLISSLNNTTSKMKSSLHLLYIWLIYLPYWTKLIYIIILIHWTNKEIPLVLTRKMLLMKTTETFYPYNDQGLVVTFMPMLTGYVQL